MNGTTKITDNMTEKLYNEVLRLRSTIYTLNEMQNQQIDVLRQKIEGTNKKSENLTTLEKLAKISEVCNVRIRGWGAPVCTSTSYYCTPDCHVKDNDNNYDSNVCGKGESLAKSIDNLWYKMIEIRSPNTCIITERYTKNCREYKLVDNEWIQVGGHVPGMFVSP